MLPLRRRKEDLPALVGHFIRKYTPVRMAGRFRGSPRMPWHPVATLLARQRARLENCIEYAVVMSEPDATLITPDAAAQRVWPRRSGDTIRCPPEPRSTRRSPPSSAVAPRRAGRNRLESARCLPPRHERPLVGALHPQARPAIARRLDAGSTTGHPPGVSPERGRANPSRQGAWEGSPARGALSPRDESPSQPSPF